MDVLFAEAFVIFACAEDVAGFLHGASCLLILSNSMELVIVSHTGSMNAMVTVLGSTYMQREAKGEKL